MGWGGWGFRFLVVANFAKTSASHSYVTEGSRPAIPFVVYEGVKEVADIMSRPDWPNHKLQSDLHQAEYILMVTCRAFRNLLPTGWRYAREYPALLLQAMARFSQRMSLNTSRSFILLYDI
uniref:Uncharacterized protein n=1 Tax=Helianthus annuus TaxID=4232 RepID=A0A251V189_HELAN